MMHIFCDHCQQRITDVVYVVETKDATDVLRQSITRSYLHWDCLPKAGRGED